MSKRSSRAYSTKIMSASSSQSLLNPPAGIATKLFARMFVICGGLTDFRFEPRGLHSLLILGAPSRLTDRHSACPIATHLRRHAAQLFRQMDMAVRGGWPTTHICAITGLVKSGPDMEGKIPRVVATRSDYCSIRQSQDRWHIGGTTSSSSGRSIYVRRSIIGR